MSAIALLPKQKPQKGQESAFLGSTFAAAGIVFVFYPMILASLGNHTNGGALGLGSLLIASVLSWRAFLCNRKTPWMRRLVQMPLTAFLTYLVIAEAVAQYRSGKWLWF